MENQDTATIDLTRFEMEIILTALKLRKYVYDDINRGVDFDLSENNLINILQDDFQIKANV